MSQIIIAYEPASMRYNISGYISDVDLMSDSEEIVSLLKELEGELFALIKTFH